MAVHPVWAVSIGRAWEGVISDSSGCKSTHHGFLSSTNHREADSYSYEKHSPLLKKYDQSEVCSSNSDLLEMKTSSVVTKSGI
ncbi:hypothetical protein BHE74_00031481 [Ensete ventricosum]|nr:hypothetical protein BHE74_00031481 [Ensete ventricosum]